MNDNFPRDASPNSSLPFSALACRNSSSDSNGGSDKVFACCSRAALEEHGRWPRSIVASTRRVFQLLPLLSHSTLCTSLHDWLVATTGAMMPMTATVATAPILTAAQGHRRWLRMSRHSYEAASPSRAYRFYLPRRRLTSPHFRTTSPAQPFSNLL